MTGRLSVDDVERLFAENGDELYRYLQALCPTAEEAQDALQTAFLKFLEQVQRERVRSSSALFYLKRMCRNEAMDFYRRTQRLQPLEVEPEAPQNSEAQSARIRRVFAEALASPQLDANVREVLQLRFVEELPAPEICRRVGRSRATVYRLMERGLAYLSTIFARHG